MKFVNRWSKLSLVALLVTFSIIVQACDKKDGGSDAAKGYAVSGKVTDASGKPLAGVEVVVESALYYNRAVTATTKADGTYSISLPKNDGDSWYPHASFVKPYNGKNYTIELHPDNADDFAGKNGAIRNFTWKLSGAMVGRNSGNSGGTFYFNPWSVSDFENITFTFEPVGSLIDGSAGSVITRKITRPGTEIKDIPIGRYKVTASYATPLLLRITDSGATPASFVIADMAPWSGTYKNTAFIDVFTP